MFSSFWPFRTLFSRRGCFRPLFCACDSSVCSARTPGRSRGANGGAVALARRNGRPNEDSAEILGGRQADFARAVAEKLDISSHRVNERLEISARATLANLGALNERLGLIDAAQARLTGLTQKVVGLRQILGNKQTRGAFGQGRMEAIIRDALPANAYAFQHTLSTGARPDCALKLQGDDKILAVDAKFPLEAFTALKDAAARARENGAGAGASGSRQTYHGYFGALFAGGRDAGCSVLFVPSELIFAELHDSFRRRDPEGASRPHPHRLALAVAHGDSGVAGPCPRCAGARSGPSDLGRDPASGRGCFAAAPEGSETRRPFPTDAGGCGRDPDVVREDFPQRRKNRKDGFRASGGSTGRTRIFVRSAVKCSPSIDLTRIFRRRFATWKVR